MSMKQAYKKEVQYSHQNIMHMSKKFKDDNRFANKTKNETKPNHYFYFIQTLTIHYKSRTEF